MNLSDYLILEGVEGNYNLKKLYDKFNRQYFANQLPDIPVKWNNSKSSIGSVKVTATANNKLTGLAARYNPSTGTIDKWKGLFISQKFSLSETDLFSAMLHEMIHVWVFAQGILYTSGDRSGHGDEFKKKLKELQTKVPFKIIEKESDMEASETLEDVERGYIFCYKPRKNLIVQVTPKWLKTNLDKLTLKFREYRNFFPEYYYEFGLSKSKHLAIIKGVRTVAFKAWQLVDEVTIDNIRDQSTVLMKLGDYRK